MSTSEQKMMLDIVPEHGVMIEIGTSAGGIRTVWVNIDGICRLRVQGGAIKVGNLEVIVECEHIYPFK